MFENFKFIDFFSAIFSGFSAIMKTVTGEVISLVNVNE